MKYPKARTNFKNTVNSVRRNRKLLFRLSLLVQLPTYIAAAYRFFKKDKKTAKALLFVGGILTLFSAALLCIDDEEDSDGTTTERLNEKTKKNDGTKEPTARVSDNATEATSGKTFENEPNGKTSNERDEASECQNGTKTSVLTSYDESRDESVGDGKGDVCDEPKGESVKSDKGESNTDELGRINEAIRILQSVETMSDFED